jgi:hypothetical protein
VLIIEDIGQRAYHPVSDFPHYSQRAYEYGRCRWLIDARLLYRWITWGSNPDNFVLLRADIDEYYRNLPFIGTVNTQKFGPRVSRVTGGCVAVSPLNNIPISMKSAGSVA